MDILPASFDALRAYPQFIVYKLAAKQDRPGKLDKIPVDGAAGKPIDPHNPNAWMHPEAAIAAAKKLGNGYGVGYVLTENDPFWFLDIDSGYDPQTGWSPISQELWTAFNGAAVEISASGKGLHIIGTGTPPPHRCKNSPLNIEFYTSGRFIALTGNAAAGDANKSFTAELEWLVNKYFPVVTNNTAASESVWTTAPHVDWSGPEDDNELITKALQSKSTQTTFGGKASFADLWNNNIDALTATYGTDQSSYDGALAMQLAFWTGNNCERMKRLMLQSGLMRDKYEREGKSGYLNITILTACSKQTKFYNDNRKAKVNAATDELGTLLHTEEQLIHFKGCTYVQDLEAIFVPGGYLLNKSQFKVAYGSKTFKVSPTRLVRDAWEAFTENQYHTFPRVISAAFRPDLEPGIIFEKNGKTFVNNYWPIPVKRTPGDVTPFLNHVKKLIPDEHDQTILLAYLAACVQHKGIKFNWCPFIQGVQGNGKTLLTKCVVEAIGRDHVHLPQPANLTEKYNDWMTDKILIGIEDIYVSDSATEVMETLKIMITGELQEIRSMHKNKVTREVCCNFILNSNHKDGIKKIESDRRYAPFYTAQQTKEDLQRDGMTTEYFKNLYGWLNNGGYAIVTDWLYTHEIPEQFNPARGDIAPLTSSTQEAISHSMGGLEQEVQEAIEQHEIGFRNGWVSGHYLNLLLERLRANRLIKLNARSEFMLRLGYIPHPGLEHGRVNNPIMPDNKRIVLYIKKNHPNRYLTCAAEIAKEYTAAQS